MKDQNMAQSAQAKIWKLIYGFANTLVLRCAAELGIAEIIHKHGRPISLAELASQIPVNSPNIDRLHRIMRYLVHMKVFSAKRIDGELWYDLQPQAKFLVSGWDQCMVPSLIAITDKDFMAPWHYLKQGLEEGSTTAFERALGKNIWDYMSENPEKNRLFNGAMACDTRLVTSALIRDCNGTFEKLGSIVDVGGGTGTALTAIARAFPHLKCTVYDLPHVIADSPEHPEVTRVQGDMFEFIPSADAVLMKCILHDWDDEQCIKILKNCKEAVPRDGGKVIIVDIVLDLESDEAPFTHMRRCMDLDMMINAGGRERTKEEWKKLIISGAGYASYNIKTISAVQSVIEAYP